jgi:hypothetical protein
MGAFACIPHTTLFGIGRSIDLRSFFTLQAKVAPCTDLSELKYMYR